MDFFDNLNFYRNFEENGGSFWGLAEESILSWKSAN